MHLQVTCKVKVNRNAWNFIRISFFVGSFRSCDLIFCLLCRAWSISAQVRKPHQFEFLGFVILPNQYPPLWKLFLDEETKIGVDCSQIGVLDIFYSRYRRSSYLLHILLNKSKNCCSCFFFSRISLISHPNGRKFSCCSRGPW